MNALARLAETSARLAAPGALLRIAGTVTEITPTTYRARGLSAFAKLGDCVALEGAAIQRHGEIVRIDADSVTIKPYATTSDVRLGAGVAKTDGVMLAPTPSWRGRIIDALGQPVDGLGPLETGSRRMPIHADAPPALERARVNQALKSGVRVLDIFTPICHGQRIGIFAGSGVGKSTLLGMLAGSKGFDTVVIALVGERGREVREFIEDSLGANRPLAVTVVATGDESAMMRMMAPLTATAIAEYFRDRGDRVLLMVDSVTRYAHAARDVALAAGEPAVARGYAPSVFTSLPRLLERAGPGLETKIEGQKAGSITGIFSVLVDGDDHNDPVADCIRGTLDGHIVLDRAIADASRYPAINVLGSISRLAHQVWTPDQRNLVGRLRAMISRFEDTRDLRLMGGLQTGTDADLDQAVMLTPIIYEALTQAPNGPPSTDAFRELAEALGQDKVMKDTVVVNGKFGPHAKAGPRLVVGDGNAGGQMQSKLAKLPTVETPKSGLIDKTVPVNGLSSDFTLGAVGCGLAAASVSFGMYMTVHGPAPHEPGKDFSVFAQFAPRTAPPARSVASARNEDTLDMTATASIPRRGPPRNAAPESALVEAADTNAATISIDGRSLKVRVGDTIPGAGEVLAIYPGVHPLVKTSRGTILAARAE